MKVLFVCSGGMSSAIAVKALQDEALKNGVEMEVLAIGSAEMALEVKNGFDIVMVAPQIRHRFKELNQLAVENNIPCELIEPMAYSPMGGKKLYAQAMKLAGK